MTKPLIIGCIGHLHIKGLKNQRDVKKAIAKKVLKKYYSEDSVFMSQLRLGANMYFAELITYLQLRFDAVIAFESQLVNLGRPDLNKMNKILKASYSTYTVPNIPDYKISKKKIRKMVEKYGERHYRRFLYKKYYKQADKFIIDNCDKLIIVWEGTRVGNHVYRDMLYAKEIGKEDSLDVIHYGSKLL